MDNKKGKSNSYGAKIESLGQHLPSAEDIISIPWNDIEIFKKIIKKYKKNISAIIMEPIMCNTCVILPKIGYLEEIREICSKEKIILIFDEVITGFRISLGGAQEYLNVIPDLSIFAKGIASGFSLSCLTGRKKIMDNFDVNKVVHGGTYNSNVVNTVAALKTIEEMDNNNFFKKLNNYRKKLTKEFINIATKKKLIINIQGVGSIFHISFTNKKILNNYQDYIETDKEKLKIFIQKLQNNKIRITGRGTWFISSAHSKRDMEKTIISFKKCINKL